MLRFSPLFRTAHPTQDIASSQRKGMNNRLRHFQFYHRCNGSLQEGSQAPPLPLESLWFCESVVPLQQPTTKTKCHIAFVELKTKLPRCIVGIRLYSSTTSMSNTMAGNGGKPFTRQPFIGRCCPHKRLSHNNKLNRGKDALQTQATHKSDPAFKSFQE